MSILFAEYLSELSTFLGAESTLASASVPVFFPEGRFWEVVLLDHRM